MICPSCKKPPVSPGGFLVTFDRTKLTCKSCGTVYPVKDDIPMLLIDDAGETRS